MANFVEINGIGYDNFPDALEALREAWSEYKAPAVAEQLLAAKNKAGEEAEEGE